MNKDLDEKLCKDFPLLFADRNGDMRTTGMCWGFECGDGWYGIIREAAEKLEPLIAAEVLKDPYAHYQGFFRASQVKEKYGTLRFYLSGGTDKMHRIVSAAERKSAKVCEECGEPGVLRGDGWYYTACWKHAKRD